MLLDYLNGAETLDASTDNLRRFIAHLLDHRSPATSAVRYRVTAAVPRLGRPRQPSPVEDLRKPLKACQGRDSRQLRDTALTRRIHEPGGMHRAEVIGLTVGSIDPDSDVAVVIGKGPGPRAGSSTATAPGRR
jgi:site-specific recombinase XerC